MNELLEIARERGELDFLYNITKLCAETDSIGEGYNYCNNYTKDTFEGKENSYDEDYVDENTNYMDDRWLPIVGLPIYELYLKQIGIESLSRLKDLEK